MKSFPKFLSAVLLIAAGVAMLAPSPGASSEHFVIVNNNDDFFRAQGDNYGTVLKLAGTRENPLLNQVASLATDVQSSGGGIIPTVAVVRVGADICVFLTTNTYQIPNEISAFKYPGLTLVGNYSDSNLPDYYPAQGIAASGGYLYATYGGAIGSWAIGSGCTLSLAQMYTVNAYNVQGMAVTQGGATLVLSESAGEYCCVDSFSIGVGGTLTEHGPYTAPTDYGPYGMDITADGQYAIVAGLNNCTEQCDGSMMVYPINADGSLGYPPVDFNMGTSWFNDVRLSPNEKYLYASGGNSNNQIQVITLKFTENPLNFSFGCTTTLNAAPGPLAWSLATTATTGAGGGLYVAEANTAAGLGAVGLLAIDPSTGCTTEAPQSPFSLGDPTAVSVSLFAWPPAVLRA